MRFTLTVIIGTDARFEFVGTQQLVRFRHGPLAMDPLRFDGIEPWTCAGQRADHQTYPHGALLDLPIALTDPALHGMTAVPGGVIPDQPQRGAAVGHAVDGAPRQQLAGARTDGTPRHTPQPPRVRLGR